MNMQSVDVSWGLIRGLPEGAENLLSPTEAQHYSQLRFAVRRQSYLLGRLAGKLLLLQQPEFAGCKPGDITIANNPLGMPIASVQGEAILGSFSLSHSGDLGVSAYTSTPGFTLGVDAEMLAPRSAGFVQDFFTPREVAFIATQTVDKQSEWTNQLWSAKEAVLKALGLGLRVDTRQVEILPDISPLREENWQPLQVNSPLFKPQSCQVFSCQQENFVLSMAVLSQAERTEPFRVNIQQMVLEVPLLLMN